MDVKNYDQLIEMVQQHPLAHNAVSAAGDRYTVEAAITAYENRIAKPTFIGNATTIRKILEDMGKAPGFFDIIDEKDDVHSVHVACTLVHEGKADFVTKGFMDTAGFLRGILDKKVGLRTGRPMSHITFLQVPGFPKLLVMTDGGMVVAPDLEGKKNIIINAVEIMLGIGYKCPKIAVLAAVEKVNKAMPETEDAARLQEMSRTGEIADCIIEGPVSYDIVVSPESARKKGFHGKYSGNYDLLLVPHIATGNILSKSLIYHLGAKMAGIVAGARVPLAVSSRTALIEEKYYATVLAAAALIHKRRQK